MHNDFTVFTRKVPSGKKVFYYYAYNEEGKRAGPWSTGQLKRTEAKNYCHQLIRKGKLLKNKKAMPTLAEYADGFFDFEKSPYFKERRKQADITMSYADTKQKIVRNQLLPHFGEMRLDAITPEAIEKWQDSLLEKGMKHNTINNCFGTLQIILKWALKRKVIETDPMLTLQRLIKNKTKREILTRAEFSKLFSQNWREIWGDDFMICTANKLAAYTGMRSAEIRGLRGVNVHEDHIFVCEQYHKKYGLTKTKTKTEDGIPILPAVAADLMKLKELNGDGFVFSMTGGEMPMTDTQLYYGLLKALEKIGIDEQERKRRNITFHAWRHYCNTELLRSGLTVPEVQAVTRHKSLQMTGHYTHFEARQFADTLKVQETWLEPTDVEAGANEAQGQHLTLVKNTDSGKKQRKQKAS